MAKHCKHPLCDACMMARSVQDASTIEGVLAMSEDAKMPSRARGGHARAAKLPAEQRSAIASEAAKRRWEARRQATSTEGLPKVLEGYANTLDLAGTKLPCAVIDGPNGIQRVLSEHGITRAILGSRS